MEVSQSIQQTTCDQFHKLITEHADNKSEIAKTIIDILENPSLNTFSEFLHLEEIDKVCRLSLSLKVLTRFRSQFKVGEYERYYNTLNLFAVIILSSPDPLVTLNEILNFSSELTASTWRTKRSWSRWLRLWRRSWSILQFSQWRHRRKLCPMMISWMLWGSRMFVTWRT